MPSSLKGLSVLVLDDNPRAQALWHAILASVGAIHIGAADTSTAEDLLQMHDVDLLVIDEHIGNGERGSDFARRLRLSLERSLPTMACTSDDTPGSEQRLAAAGVTALIRKPIIVTDALSCLKEIATLLTSKDR